jgi:hypothetical protein
LLPIKLFKRKKRSKVKKSISIQLPRQSKRNTEKWLTKRLKERNTQKRKKISAESDILMNLNS